MKVSVVIPTFNRAHLLGQAIDSVLRQTYANFEIIVVDDGSTDGTADLVARYGERVRYFSQANAGVSAARNTALEHVTGDCIAFLDSDDYWFDFKLEVQVGLLKRLAGVGFLFTEFEILKDDGKRIPQGSRTWLAADIAWEQYYSRCLSSRALGVEASGAPANFPVYTGRMYRHFLDEAFVLPTTAIVRRDALGGQQFPEGMAIFEDWEFFARLAREHEAAFMDLETAVNRGHEEPGRLTRCSSLAKAQRYLDMLERVWKADARFRSEYAEVLGRVESGAVIAVAQQAMLAARPDLVEQALTRWRCIDGRTLTHKALTIAVLSHMPGGRHVLRAGMLGKKLLASKMLSRNGNSPVNPSA